MHYGICNNKVWLIENQLMVDFFKKGWREEKLAASCLLIFFGSLLALATAGKLYVPAGDCFSAGVLCKKDSFLAYGKRIFLEHVGKRFGGILRNTLGSCFADKAFNSCKGQIRHIFTFVLEKKE